MKNWIKIDQPTIDEVNSLQADLKIPHFICSLLLQRDVNSLNKAKTFFRPKLDSLHDPYLMKDMNKAVDRINNAKRESENLISNSYVLQEAVVEANTLIKQAEKESQAYRIKIEDEMDTLFTELQTKIEQLNLYITNEKNSLRKPREIIEPE